MPIESYEPKDLEELGLTPDELADLTSGLLGDTADLDIFEHKCGNGGSCAGGTGGCNGGSCSGGAGGGQGRG